jgi:hypothetical protein
MMLGRFRGGSAFFLLTCPSYWSQQHRSSPTVRPVQNQAAAARSRRQRSIAARLLIAPQPRTATAWPSSCAAQLPEVTNQPAHTSCYWRRFALPLPFPRAPFRRRFYLPVRHPRDAKPVAELRLASWWDQAGALIRTPVRANRGREGSCWGIDASFSPLQIGW